MQRLKQWELKRAIYEKKALAKPETAKQGPNCIVSQMEVSLFELFLLILRSVRLSKKDSSTINELFTDISVGMSLHYQSATL